MEFDPEKTEEFIAIFESGKERIRSSKGCHHLELLRHKDQPHIFFTLSIWESEDALNAYRHSAFFADTWKKTKALFIAKPQAWSLESLAVLDKDY